MNFSFFKAVIGGISDKGSLADTVEIFDPPLTAETSVNTAW
jgi:hypothetical protein